VWKWTGGPGRFRSLVNVRQKRLIVSAVGKENRILFLFFEKKGLGKHRKNENWKVDNGQ